MTTSVVIKREHAMIKVTFVANTCESDVIDVRQFAGGNIHLPSTWTTARLAFKLAPNEDGTFQKHYDEDGVRIGQRHDEHGHLDAFAHVINLGAAIIRLCFAGIVPEGNEYLLLPEPN